MTTTYLFEGKDLNLKADVCIVLDVPDGTSRPFNKAYEIVSPDDVIIMSVQNLFVAIPEDRKGVLFPKSELYTYVPELDPANIGRTMYGTGDGHCTFDHIEMN